MCVYDGSVLLLENGKLGPLLGSLAGARAEVVTARVGNNRTGGQRFADATLAAYALKSPVGLLAGAYSGPKKGGIAVVALADGKARQTTLPDEATAATAQTEAARFNTLAAPAVSGSGGTGISAELERLGALHSSGVLDDDEFKAAKALIIGGEKS